MAGVSVPDVWFQALGDWKLAGWMQDGGSVGVRADSWW